MTEFSDTTAITIRPATPDDLPALGVLGARLVRLHHTFDAQRFMTPGSDLERGYANFLDGLRRRDDALLLVAEVNGAVAGYLYGSLEPRSWEALRDEAGFINDLIVDQPAAGHGVASLLVERATAWFRDRGVPRVVLHTADQNAPAQRLFARLGFRRTMVEMTKELG